jgi:hypothetical protein
MQLSDFIKARVGQKRLMATYPSTNRFRGLKWL